MKNRIKELRAKNGLTQEALAQRVRVSRQSVNAIEKGRYLPSAALAMKIAREFGCPVEHVFELEESD